MEERRSANNGSQPQLPALSVSSSSDQYDGVEPLTETGPQSVTSTQTLQLAGERRELEHEERPGSLVEEMAVYSLWAFQRRPRVLVENDLFVDAEPQMNMCTLRLRDEEEEKRVQEFMS